jgi:hypothetical protein
MKTYKQKQKRKRARERARIKCYEDRFKHCMDRKWKTFGGHRPDGQYILFDDKTKQYYKEDDSKKVIFSKTKKKACVLNVYNVNWLIEKFGHTGAWRPIAIN